MLMGDYCWNVKTVVLNNQCCSYIASYTSVDAQITDLGGGIALSVVQAISKGYVTARCICVL